MGRFLDVFAALVSSKEKTPNADTLLAKAHDVLVAVSAHHWSSDQLVDIPEMIRDLARDRDDYRRMSEAYRLDLAEAESELAKATAEVARLKEEVEFHSQLRQDNLRMYLCEVERLLKEKHGG